MNKVSDEWFDDHLMDDTAVVTPNKSSSSFDENDLFTSIKFDPTAEYDDANNETNPKHLPNDLDRNCKRPPEDKVQNLKRPPEDLVKEFAEGFAVSKNLHDNVNRPPGDLYDNNNLKDEAEDIVRSAEDDNGLIFAPSCVAQCFL
jgi:hypothetical protein